MNVSKLEFTLKDVLQILGVGAMFIGQYYSLRSDIKELVIYKTADDKVVNARLDKLEEDVSKANNILFVLRYNNKLAIIPEQTKIKDE